MDSLANSWYAGPDETGPEEAGPDGSMVFAGGSTEAVYGGAHGGADGWMGSPELPAGTENNWVDSPEPPVNTDGGVEVTDG